MNAKFSTSRSLLATGVALALLGACATVPTEPQGAATLRAKLTQLQAQPELATRAPLAFKEADLAVAAAERPQADPAIGAHLVFLADRRIAIARAQAESRLAVDQRPALAEEREASRLQARTQEANNAEVRASLSRADASAQKLDAAAARNEADTARDANADAQRNSQDLQRQLDDLHAQATERGMVLTLGDVLFATGTADLNASGNAHLSKLAGFLNQHPERTVTIEGYTDSVGSDAYNQGLSQRRADAVKSYLIVQGVDATHLTASGKGEYSPVADNASATGRQQNRRVEVIIANSQAGR